MRSLSYDDLLDAVANSAAGIPDSRSLDGLITRLGKLSQIIDRRGVWCDKGMRLVASERKIHYSEMAAGGGGRRSGGAGDDSKDENDAGEKKSNKKKRKASDNLAPPDSNARKYSFGHAAVPEVCWVHFVSPCEMDGTQVYAGCLGYQ